MDNHKRMTRTLAALVASMTVGALCLDWMLPARTVVPAGPGIELMALGPTSRTWEGIRIESRNPETGLRPEQAHFLVYRNGSPARTSSWEAQRVLDDRPVVRITVLSADGDKQITAAQRSAALNLVKRLQKEFGIPANRVIGIETIARSSQSDSLEGPAHSYSIAQAN